MNITKQDIINGLLDLGLKSGDEIEVHSSLSSFGYVDGGAETVISALKDVVGENGSIFMPALRLSQEMPLNEDDKTLGITTKIQILPETVSIVQWELLQILSGKCLIQSRMTAYSAFLLGVNLQMK